MQCYIPAKRKLVYIIFSINISSTHSFIVSKHLNSLHANITRPKNLTTANTLLCHLRISPKAQIILKLSKFNQKEEEKRKLRQTNFFFLHINTFKFSSHSIAIYLLILDICRHMAYYLVLFLCSRWKNTYE